MRLRQLSDLRSDIRLRADVVNAVARYPDPEVNEYWNQAWTKVYGLLAHTGENYYLTESPSYATTVSQDTYYTTAATGTPSGTAILPTDLWNLKGLDVQTNGALNQWTTAQRSQFEERNDYWNANFSWPSSPKYDYQGSGASASIRFLIVPQAIYPFRLWYYPACVRLVADSDTVDGGNGWERMGIDIAARWLAERDENFELCARLDSAIADWDARIRGEAASRNLGQAPKMRRSLRYKNALRRLPTSR